ncbi:MAG: DUF167 domain-containing protein [Acidimicrobiia bacterium]|nr:DUF167 domain-containing protein [Acidimicrobiia bacterium]
MTGDVISVCPDGVIVEVWVVPGASRDSLGGIHDGALRVRTAAPAEGGKANRAVARLVAERIGVRRAEVVAGAHSRRKRVLLAGADLATVRRALGVGED